jgi:hypothetical protein
MLRRAAAFGLALLLSGCTDQVLINDAWDAGAPDLAPTDLPPAPDLPRSRDAQWHPPEGVDASCSKYQRLAYTTRSPQLVLLLDRSQSMQAAFGNTTREAAARSALLAAVSTYQARVKFGFAQFPADSNDKSYSECQRGYCCAGPVDVQPQTNNYTAMSGAIQCSSSPCPTPSADSPSNAALLQAKEYFKSKSEWWYTRFVLLLTASEPDCAVASGGDTCDSAVAAARELGNIGVGVGVISVDYQPGPNSCLTQISQSGETFLQAYSPRTVNALTDAVDDLVLTVAKIACTVDLDTAPPAQVTPIVSLDKDPIAEDEQNGWSYANYAHTSITLAGAACEKYLRPPASTLYVGYNGCAP